MWVEPQRCDCLVTWFCYHLIAKPGNRTAPPSWPGARFTKKNLPAIQIRWKLYHAITLLLAIRLQQIFAHATTAQLSCHVQNFVAITIRIKLRVKRNIHRIWIAMEKLLVKRARTHVLPYMVAPTWKCHQTGRGATAIFHHLSCS